MLPSIARACLPRSNSAVAASSAAAAAAAAAAAPRAVAADASSAAPPPPQLPPLGYLEVREYLVAPAGLKEWLALTQEHAALRSKLLPFLGMLTCDTGGELSKVTHFYAYPDLDARDAARRAAAANPEWAAYIAAARPHVLGQESKIMVEAAALYGAVGAPGAARFQAPEQGGGAAAGPALYELRSYQLHPGYAGVPKLLAAFQQGLPEKVAADPDGKLVAFAHSEVGLLNNVLELWRYPSAAACVRARQASRGVQAWRDTIAAVTPGVQSFQSTFTHPLPCSPWQ